jgi:hypothetical protein
MLLLPLKFMKSLEPDHTTGDVHRRQMMVRLAVSCQQSGMNDDSATSPYTLTILPCERLSGHFDWVIRRHGKLVERSDRHYPSEPLARESGQAALERQLHEDRAPRSFQPQQRNRRG